MMPPRPDSVRVELGQLDELVAEMFALVIFVSDELLFLFSFYLFRISSFFSCFQKKYGEPKFDSD